jgi:hypothetical protein
MPLSNSLIHDQPKSAALYSNVRSDRIGASVLKPALTIVALSFFYAAHAEGRESAFILCSWLTAVLCIIFVFWERPTETLTAAKVTALLYCASFAIGPVWLAEVRGYRWFYFGNEVEELLSAASVLTLVGSICFLLGYFSVTRLSARTNTIAATLPHDFPVRGAMTGAVILGSIGFVSYVGLVINSGGIGRLLGYVGGRADMLAGVYGAWFWGMHLLFAAFGLLCVATMSKHPWLCLLVALMLSAAFVPLQGRDIVVAPIFCWLLMYSALHRRLRWRTVVSGILVIVLMSALLGAFRGGNIRNNAEDFLSTFQENATEHMIKVVSDNIEQLDAVMTAVSHEYKGNKPIGPMVLASWVEPVDRALLGDIIPSIYSGIYIDRLLMPEHKGWNTAASPSLPGELYIGMRWKGLIFGMTLYGVAMGMLSRWHDGRYRNPVMYAAYPFVVYILAKMVVDGTTHGFRALIIYVAVFLWSLFATPTRHRKDKANHGHKPLFSFDSKPFSGH